MVSGCILFAFFGIFSSLTTNLSSRRKQWIQGGYTTKKTERKKTWNAIFFMGNLPVLLIFLQFFSGKRFHTLISFPFHNSTISVFIPFWYYDYYNGFFRINYMIERIFIFLLLAKKLPTKLLSEKNWLLKMIFWKIGDQIKTYFF